MIDIEFNPPGPVTRALFEDYTNEVQLIRGPVGSGKTTTIMVKLLAMAMRQTPNPEGVRLTRFFIVRTTYQDLIKTTVNDWDVQWRPLASYRHLTRNPLRDQIRFAMGDGTRVDCQIEFVALDRLEDVERVRGANYTAGWGNELKQLYNDHLETLVGRVGRYPSMAQGGVLCDPELAIFLGDTNSPDDEHWLYKREHGIDLKTDEVVIDPQTGLPRQPERWAFYTQPAAAFKTDPRDPHSPWAVNPGAENLQNLPPGYYERLLRTYSEDRIKVDIANEYGYVQEGKVVYPEYVDSTHCSAAVEYDPTLPLILGADGGLTPAVVVCQLSPAGQLRVIDEFVSDTIGQGVKPFWRNVVKPGLQARYPSATVAVAVHDPAGDNRGEGEGKSAIGLLNDAYEMGINNPATGEIMYAPGHEPLNLGFMVEEAPTNDPTIRQSAVRHFLTSMIDGAPGFLIAPRCKVLRAGFNGKYYYRQVQVSGPERFHEKPDKGLHSHPHDGLQYACLAARGGWVQGVQEVVEEREWDASEEGVEGAAMNEYTGY